MKRLFCSFVIAVAVTVFAPLNAFAAGPDTEASVISTRRMCKRCRS